MRTRERRCMIQLTGTLGGGCSPREVWDAATFHVERGRVALARAIRSQKWPGWSLNRVTQLTRWIRSRGRSLWMDSYRGPCFTWNIDRRSAPAWLQRGRGAKWARRARHAVAGWLAVEITPVPCVGPGEGVSRETTAACEGPSVESGRLRDTSSPSLPQCRSTRMRRRAACGERPAGRLAM